VIQLDTSFLIRALVRRSTHDRLLREWLGTGEQLGISATAWAEFLCGPVAPRQIELAARVVPHRLAFSEAEATVTADLFNGSGRRRGSLIDCMIAATAIRLDDPLATVNPDDFRRFEKAGLKLISA
jgi:predicted nucleic acid-binding protein